MKPVWIVIAIIAIGFAGAGFVFSKDRLPPILRDLFLTGWEFFLLGAIIGPAGFGLIGPAQLGQLDPFIALGLAWAGLIFGAQLRFEDLKKISPAMKLLTLAQTILVGAGVFALFAAASWPLLDAPWSHWLAASFVVAAAGAISSPTAISLMSPRFDRSKSSLLRTLMIITTLDVGPAIVLVGLVFCFFSTDPGAGFSFGRGVIWLFYSVVIAAALAGLFRLFDRKRLSEEDNLAVLIGFLVFISGAAFYLDLSPLFLSALAGVFLANILPHDDRIHTALHATEKPFYVILLIVAGMWWEPGGVGAWLVAVGLVAARLVLKREAMDATAAVFLKDERPPKGSGLALGAQGALAFAIGLSFALAYPGEAANLAYSVIAIGAIINEALAPALIRRALGDER